MIYIKKKMVSIKYKMFRVRARSAPRATLYIKYKMSYIKYKMIYTKNKMLHTTGLLHLRRAVHRWRAARDE